MKALIVKDCTKSYANGVKALKGINLSVEQGEFFGLLGPNGAGKSTLIGIISSLVNKTGGHIEILGADLAKSPALAKANVGLVPQEFNFNVFEKVIDILINQAGYYGVPYKQARERAEFYLQKLGLHHKAKMPARSLSGGQKRRLLIIRALVHEPQLLILDEPTAGVDIELRHLIWDFLQDLNRQGRTIILTTHYLEEAEGLCKRIAIIDQGEIIADTHVKELLKRLDRETFVLDLRSPLQQLPELAGFDFAQTDDYTLEVSCPKEQSLNQLFAVLTEQGCEVMSMRNKLNRLEGLFLDLVKANTGALE